MKVGISTSMIQRGKTGVAQYLFALLRGFQKVAREHRFTLFVLEEDLPLFEFARDFFEIISMPERFRSPIRNIAWHQTALPRLARRKGLDLLHVPSYRRMLWAHPCPLVATIHDLAPFRIQGKYDRMRMFYGKVVARQLARRQDQIIAISHNTAADLAQFFRLGPERVTVIHNGMEHDRFFPSDRLSALEAVRNRHGLEGPFLLYTARLEHPAKNHVRLIDAFDQFKQSAHSNWKLVFAGGDWHGAEAIHQRISRSPFAAEIRSLGFVPDADLPALYRAAEIFVYPSLYEGFGLPPLEAMACACPVICSARGALGEVVGSAAKIVDPENIPGMAAAIRNLATDSGLREKMRQAGLVQAAGFNWDRTAAATLAVYQSVLEKVSKRFPAGRAKSISVANSARPEPAK